MKYKTRRKRQAFKASTRQEARGKKNEKLVTHYMQGRQRELKTVAGRCMRLDDVYFCCGVATTVCIKVVMATNDDVSREKKRDHLYRMYKCETEIMLRKYEHNNNTFGVAALERVLWLVGWCLAALRLFDALN
jgi:hypothetical protein